MTSEQIGKPLINTTTLQIQQEYKQEDSAFIERYNQVINCYNRNIQNGPRMQVMVGSAFMNKISRIMNSKRWLVFMALVLIFLPVVNVVCLSCIFSYLFYLKRQNKKHKRNISRVNDPFKYFYFLPEVCEQLGKHFTSLNLQQNQIEGFTFNQQLRKSLSSKIKENSSLTTPQGQTLTVIIYDQYFFDSFHLYRKQLFKTVIWTTASIILLTLSIIFYLDIFSLL